MTPAPPTADLDRFRGCLLGLAAGDAVGPTVEFRRRGTFPPVPGMAGGGPFRLEPGEWTDDTSMALCLAESLVEAGGFDPRDQMERYVRWWHEGYWSSNGRCFDIGITVRGSLCRYLDTRDPYAGPTDPMSAGNGCIMRLAPVPMFYAADETVARSFAAASSRTTHGATECLDACALLAGVLCRALRGEDKRSVLLADADSFQGSARLMSIARGDYRRAREDDIRGTGYVVDCLEAALWCFDRGRTFEDAILLAANLGDDADTTAAVCGQIAGAFHGARGIPAAWLAKLARRDEITRLADALHRGPARRPEAPA
jgi:ADP-ribosyl-[dinitrogen reductase] hydrolase